MLFAHDTSSMRRHRCQRRARQCRRILALAIALFILLSPTTLNSEELTREETHELALEWLARNTSYNVPTDVRPPVLYTTVEVINKLYYKTEYVDQSDTRALFSLASKIIILPRDPSISFMENWGYSVHEHTHWLQYINGAYESFKNKCSDWDEIEAYSVHLKWVTENSLPKEHIKSIEASMNKYKSKCARWNDIVSGRRLWELSGVYYCTTEEYARKIFSSAKTSLGSLVSVAVQDVQHLFTLEMPLKLPCGIFLGGDVGLVTRLIESRIVHRTGTWRLAEIVVRNADDSGRFTRTLFAVSPLEFKPLEDPEMD
jgi:hypothetical protein